MVTRHRKLCFLFFNGEIGHLSLFWEFIPKSQAVIEQPKPNGELSVGTVLHHHDGHFIILIANLALLAPYRVPGFIHLFGLRIGDLKIIHQGVLIIHELQSELTRFNNLLALIIQGIDRSTCFSEGEKHGDLAVGRFYRERGCSLGPDLHLNQTKDGKGEQQLFHTTSVGPKVAILCGSWRKGEDEGRSAKPSHFSLYLLTY